MKSLTAARTNSSLIPFEACYTLGKEVSGMDSLMVRIDALVTDDADEFKPTTYAYEGVLAFLRSLEDIPQGAVSTDQSGAIYLYWHNGNKHLQLTYPANAKVKPYIYWRQEEDTDMITNADTQCFAERLHWLTQ